MGTRLLRSSVRFRTLAPALVAACVLTMCLPAVAGAAGRVVWSATPGVRGSSLRLLSCAAGPAGSVYVAGNRSTSSPSSVWFCRYGARGARVWTKTWAPVRGTALVGMAVDGGGNVYLCAATGAGLGSFVAKYSRTGKRLWQRILDDGSSSSARAITLDGAGAVYVAAVTSVDASTSGCRVTKLAAEDGETILDYSTSWGAYPVSEPVGLAATPAGDCYVACNLHGDNDLTAGYLLLVTSDGFSTGQIYEGNLLSGIKLLPSGDLAVLGWTGGGDDIDVVAMRCSTSCQPVWWQKWSSSGQRQDWASDLEVDGRGGVWVVGQTTVSVWEARAFVVRWDADGQRVFAQTAARSGYGAAATDARGNGWVVGGGWVSQTRKELAAARYSASGHRAWQVRGLAGSTQTMLNDVCLGPSGSLYACGDAGTRRGLVVRLRR